MPVESRGVAVSARDLTYEYRRRGEDAVPVLAGLDLEMRAGERIAVTGRSGAGKTTLLALLGGLERLPAGRLQVGGVDVSELDGDALARYRGTTIGFVFQHFGLLGTLTAQENVELAMAVASISRAARRRPSARAPRRSGARKPGEPPAVRTQWR